MNRDNPLVSIVIPTKDRCDLLLETLASVRCQTYEHWEAVVVDDLSTDNTWAVLLDLGARDLRIRPLRRVGSVGGSQVCRNQGFAASRGEFAMFLDSDDLLTPSAINGRLQAFEQHPDADAVVFQSEHFTDFPGQNTKETAYRIHTFKGVDPLDAFLGYHAPWYTSGPLWRRASLNRVGPWDVRVPFGQDLQFHVRALISGVRFCQHREVDQYHRGHSGPRITQTNNLKNVSKRLALLDDIIDRLMTHDMLTARRKRMLAWSAFWSTMGYTSQRPRLSNAETLQLWRAARERGLFGAAGYAFGYAVFVLQRINPIGALLREMARLAVYNDLKQRSIFHPAFLVTFIYQLRWKIERYRMRFSPADAHVSLS